MSTIPKHRQLPDKENKLFKEILMNYELKQYKKGLKAADTVLKKFPNHGETLALKALTLYSSLPFPATLSSLPKQEEAEQLARTAVKKDITSHMTWHVLGIMAKNKKDYGEASRAFAMARKQDGDNIPILRDSISLSLHTRSYPAAVSARHHLLTIRPQLRGSWIGLIIAHYLNGDAAEAVEVYDQLNKASQTEDSGMSKAERAQLGLFVVKACRKAGRAEDGLRRVEEGVQGGWLSLRGEVGEIKAEILLELGRHQEAEDAYRQLIEQNSDNLAYYAGFLRTKGLDIDEPTESTLPKILQHLDAFHSLYPRSIVPRRLTLRVAQGDDFRIRVKSYIIDKLEKGIPSLFVDVKSLYSDQEKMRVVGEVVEGLIGNLEGEISVRGDDSTAPPTALLWAYYFLALHLSHPSHPSSSSNYPRSLSLLDVALQHTPTLPEIYMAKARILKRSGDAYLAAVTMEQARDLDGQDRYINGKAAKYWVRAGRVDKGEELQGMFTKKDMSPIADLTDLQCLWFVREEGDAYRAKGAWAMGLKRYMSIVNIFKEYDDDQYDFHTYCLRRNTLSAYADLMKYEDSIRSHPAYVHAALGAIEIFTRAFDDPTLADEKLSPEEEAERKRAAKKAQKAEQKAKKAAAASSDGKKEEAPIPDEDPHGLVLIKTETPLEEALKVWQPLEQLCADNVRTWIAGYDIRIRQGLYLAALKSLLRAKELQEGNERVHWRVLHFKRVLSKATLAPAVKSTIDALLPSLISGTEQEYNDKYLSTDHNNPRRILGAAHGSLQIALSSSSTETLDADARAPILALLSSMANDNVAGTATDLYHALDLAQLSSVGATDDEVAGLRSKYAAKLPLAWNLRSKADKNERVMGMEAEKEGDGQGEAGQGVNSDV